MPKTKSKSKPRSKSNTKATRIQTLKEAVAKTLEENPALLREALADVLEDIALAEAIKEGLNSGRATREEVFRILQRKS